MTQFLCFEGRKRSFFTLFPAISAFSRFSKFVGFGSFKSVLGSFFAFLTKKANPKTRITSPKPKIFSLTILWPYQATDRGVIFAPSFRFSTISPEVTYRSSPNLRHPLNHHFYTSCQKENLLAFISRP